MLLATHRVAPSASAKCNRLYLRKPVRVTSFTTSQLEKQVKFATAANAARARMQNLSTIAADKAAFQAQTQFKTLYQYVFNDEYNKL